MTELFDTGETYVEVPCVEDVLALIGELEKAGVGARIHAPKELDVRMVREALGLSQMAFAVRFGLEEATVRNWEQGKSKPQGPAKTLIWTIAHYPHAVIAALDMGRPETKTVAAPAVISAIASRRQAETS